MGNGSIFTDMDDYLGMADLVVSSMCPCLMEDFMAVVALIDHDLYHAALEKATDIVSFVCAVACMDVAVFQDGLRNIGNGCYDSKPLTAHGL